MLITKLVGLIAELGELIVSLRGFHRFKRGLAKRRDIYR